MIRIARLPSDRLEEYESVSIKFEVRSRASLDGLRDLPPKVRELPVEAYWKDYDESPPDRPTGLRERFEMGDWAILAAVEDERLIGGAIVTLNRPPYEIADERANAAVVVDLRVDPAMRGKGIARTLMAAVRAWAEESHCAELVVETQDINVAACRFYLAAGFQILRIDERAYPDSLDEARIVWRLPI